jgi:hypothetical protein
MKLLLSILILLMFSGCTLSKDKAHNIIEIVAKPEPVAEVVPVQEPVKEVDPDKELIKSFQWVETGDGCESGVLEHGSIVKTYTGFVTNPFSILAEVPQDFTLALGPGGCKITIPKSDPTGNMSKMGERRNFLCLFDANKILIGTEDFDGDRLDCRWKDRPVAYAVDFHCQHNRVVSRSQVFKAGVFVQVNN